MLPGMSLERQRSAGRMDLWPQACRLAPSCKFPLESARLGPFASQWIRAGPQRKRATRLRGRQSLEPLSHAWRLRPATRNQENVMQADKLKEHMEVIGADGVHVGTIDRVENNR